MSDAYQSGHCKNPSSWAKPVRSEQPPGGGRDPVALLLRPEPREPTTDQRRPLADVVPARSMRWRPAGKGMNPTVATRRAELVELHRGLAISLASRFAGRGEEMDDLVQVALIGLTKAVDRYDAERGTSITTFATATILGELKRHFRDRAWAVRPPRRVHELYLRVQPAID